MADDNQDAAESLALLLELSGHEVHAVFDGEAAIGAAEALLPDVALLDIGMPKAERIRGGAAYSRPRLG